MLLGLCRWSPDPLVICGGSCDWGCIRIVFMVGFWWVFLCLILAAGPLCMGYRVVSGLSRAGRRGPDGKMLTATAGLALARAPLPPPPSCLAAVGDLAWPEQGSEFLIFPPERGLAPCSKACPSWPRTRPSRHPGKGGEGAAWPRQGPGTCYLLANWKRKGTFLGFSSLTCVFH